MLNVKDLKKEFSSGDGTITPINGVSFQIDQGTFAAIVGKSGSGKSTLLSLLGALDTPTSGTITVNDTRVDQLRNNAATKYRRDEVGFVFQSYNLIPGLTALQNVMLPLEFAGKSDEEQLTRAKELLDDVGLTGESQSRIANKMSGGEQQRVAIARALANNPKLVLADEPTGNLDEATGELIVDLLRKIAKEHDTTIIIVTHDLDLARETDQLLVLQNGELFGSQNESGDDALQNISAQSSSSLQSELERAQAVIKEMETKLNSK
ncbi:MAG: ABC transporter ATP-binding protein [Micrococcaceae bacterium]